VRHRVLDFAAVHGATPSALARIGPAVTEAVANAVVHAYSDGEGFVECDCDIENGVLEVIIADTGDGFTVRASRGLGLGLAIVAGCCDDFGLVHGGEEPGVSVWMRFALY
jgi:anti-sigma regulatory factor (Ser/Thr protein kinase)